ncbi:nucleoside-diphosphate sugar epimerase [Actinopolyspora erythraea]|uniref:Nucleoside-diphosphate sugar epimerase n=1 Tax=Actinopolyspora erythraea TaxID=414996 RepID=A0A099D4P5_9ACTN|nr:NAD(P)H-binding protein [Actinopolyspora erythraea]ASU79013.1 nucleoside-diphosphate sugar epimerase [Actinopolyspora erythraea]KGI81138.1 nucleoside-diphosphate sugar epimerase [Actinopolyspora erythraea]
MKTAVLGATGTAGSRVVERLRAKGTQVVEVSRKNGVDLVSGDGLAAALEGVHTVVDASNSFPSDDSMAWGEALTTATRNVVAACAEQRVAHLVFLSISGVEDPAFDQFEYYLAKREQEKIVGESELDATIVKTTQWYEFATNPAAVAFHDDRVEVQDWLVQPIAADTVADVLVQEVLERSGSQRVLVTGPETIRLPELARRRLEALGDQRPVHVTEPYLPELAQGVLRAPAEAKVLGPNVEEWLATLA